MRVFLSWSGPRSREVATALHNWIPLVLQSAKPFISTGDIAKGRRWADVLTEELSRSGYGIVCITKENSSAPWLHFEAGAVSNAIDKSFVSPLLFNVDPSDIRGPFQQFQFTVYRNVTTDEEEGSKGEILSLIRSINWRLDDEHRLDEGLLLREFNIWWHDLAKHLRAARDLDVDVTQTAYSWLYANEDLVGALRKAQSEVWWITPHPSVYPLALQEAIKEGLARKVNYRFLAPFKKLEDARNQLSHLADGKPGKVEIVVIHNDEKFRKDAATDYVIVDPEKSSVQVLLSLPVKDRGFWIKAPNLEAALDFVRRFSELMTAQSPGDAGQPKDTATEALVAARPPDRQIARPASAT